MDHMCSAGKKVEIGLQCWGEILSGGSIIIKLAATQHNYIIITLKVHKMAKVV